MTKLILKVVVLLVMLVVLIPAPAERAPFAPPASLACEPQSCKSKCIELGYATGFCGVGGACECLGHPQD